MSTAAPKQTESGTVVQARTRIHARIRSSESLTVLGHVSGALSIDGPLLIEERGIVEAEVSAVEIEIAGVVVGSVRAKERLHLRPSARVIGDLFAPKILIEEGAQVRGRVDMSAPKVERSASDRLLDVPESRARPVVPVIEAAALPVVEAGAVHPSPREPARMRKPVIKRRTSARRDG